MTTGDAQWAQMASVCTRCAPDVHPNPMFDGSPAWVHAPVSAPADRQRPSSPDGGRCHAGQATCCRFGRASMFHLAPAGYSALVRLPADRQRPPSTVQTAHRRWPLSCPDMAKGPRPAYAAAARGCEPTRPLVPNHPLRVRRFLLPSHARQRDGSEAARSRPTDARRHRNLLARVVSAP